MKAASSRLIPRKPTENLELLIVRKYAGPLLKKAMLFQRIVLGAESVLTDTNNVLFETFSALF